MFQIMKTKALAAYAAAGSALLLAGLEVQAALPASVAPAVGAIEDDAQAAFDLVIPVVLSVLGLVVVVKLIKRFTNKI